MGLDKLKKQLWDIFGTLVAALFLFLIIAGFAVIGYAVYQSLRHRVDGIHVHPDDDAGNGGLKLTPQYLAPLPVENGVSWIVPVALEKKDQEGGVNKRYEPYASQMNASYSYGSYYSWGPYYNFVFIDKKTGESTLLLDRKAYIKDVYLPGKEIFKNEEPAGKPSFMLLSIAMDDTNRDGKINGKDAAPTYLVSLDGKKMTQVSPANTQLRRWSYDKETKMLFVEIVENLNGDNAFDWDDPSFMLKVDTQDPKMGQKAVPQAIEEKVSSILK